MVALINADANVNTKLIASNGNPLGLEQRLLGTFLGTITPGIASTSALPSPFAITLYDGNKLARSNFPVLAEFLCDDTTTPTGRNAWPSPPILYRVNTVIPFDLFSLVPLDAQVPVVVNLLFNGIWRIPC